jgi:hypothetical protein
LAKSAVLFPAFLTSDQYVMSALPPIAAELVGRNELPLCAKSRLMHRRNLSMRIIIALALTQLNRKQQLTH